MMKKIFFAIMAVCASLTVGAQTANTQQTNKGAVTVTQSSAISDIVNNKQGTSASSAQSSTSSAEGSNSLKSLDGDVVTVNEDGSVSSKPSTTSHSNKTTVKKPQTGTVEGREAEKLRKRTGETYIEGPKIMRGIQKVRGWRVQIYNGGNKRADREEAERRAKKVKGLHPELEIYTHFNTPRWQTTCGNFRTHKEAETLKKECINLGFKTACIVRAAIVVSQRKYTDSDLDSKAAAEDW